MLVRGGDLSLAAVFGILLGFCGLGTSPGNSEVDGEGNLGVPTADRARCIEAADGVSGIEDVDVFGGRCGLRS